MVQQGDFEVQLVSADTKTPFIEHTKDGMVFVEAEPDADYFVSVKKNQATSHSRQILKFYVDGQDLGFRKSYQGPKIYDSELFGPRDIEQGTKTTHALKFFRPDHQVVDRNFCLDRFLQDMGRVEVKIYQGIPCRTGYKYSEYQRSARLETTSSSQFAVSPEMLNVSKHGGEKEKFVRSKKGGSKFATLTKQSVSRHVRGKLLDTIQLRYTSVKGLIKVGVLDPPVGDAIYNTLRSRKRAARVTPPSKKTRLQGDGTPHATVIDLFHDSDD